MILYNLREFCLNYNGRPLIILLKGGVLVCAVKCSLAPSRNIKPTMQILVPAYRCLSVGVEEKSDL